MTKEKVSVPAVEDRSDARGRSQVAPPKGRRGDLVHYSHKPLETVRSQLNFAPRTYYEKPKGLWVSCVGPMDWAEWCEAEKFWDMSTVIAHRIELAESARVLRIRSAAQIDAFTDRWGGPCEIYRDRWDAGTFPPAINWQAVAEHFDGVIIAPYQWSRRLEDRTSWYYGWDCASGCIWNADAVAAVTPLVAPLEGVHDDTLSPSGCTENLPSNPPSPMPWSGET